LQGIEMDERKPVRVGGELEVQARLGLGGLGPEDVAVDLYVGTFDTSSGALTSRTTYAMTGGADGSNGSFVYRGKVACQDSGRFGLKVRVTPRYARIEPPVSMNLVYWG